VKKLGKGVFDKEFIAPNMGFFVPGLGVKFGAADIFFLGWGVIF
jgi:hypothetical protein